MSEEEFLWLKWFYEHIDLGPAEDDVVEIMMDQYKEKTGREVPIKYDWRKEPEHDSYN